jgi:hypothetical protein
VNLVQEFNNTVSALDKEIAIVREGLGSYSVDPTRVYSCKPRNVSKFLPLLVIFSLLVLFPYTFGLLSAQHVANSSGIVASVDLVVYQDAECTLVVDAIDWGKVCPGQDVTSVIYVTNTGNVNTTLHFETANWNPAEASGQILVNWDLPFDDLLSPGAIIPIQISLSVSNDIQNIQTFHFDILLTSSPIL